MIRQIKPLVMDLETSGIDKVKCGIWQIGAIDLNTMDTYFNEGRIDDEDEILSLADRPVLEVIGRTEKQLRDPSKQSQKHLIGNFFEWIDSRKIKNFLCQNPQFDISILEIRARKYGLKVPFHYRAFDLHTIAQQKHFEINGKFLFDKNHSDMGMKNILELCGMEDKRKAHNALEDCKLTGECFSRIIYGKGLFLEYAKFALPKYLIIRSVK